MFLSICLISFQLSCLLFVNCGGGEDICELLGFDVENDSFRIFIVDSHRPYHLSNVKENNSKVVILTDTKELEYPDDEIDGKTAYKHH